MSEVVVCADQCREVDCETRECNDNGIGGVCMFCGHLHRPRIIVEPCFVCSGPVEQPDDDHCPKCIERMLKGKP